MTLRFPGGVLTLGLAVSCSQNAGNVSPANGSGSSEESGSVVGSTGSSGNAGTGGFGASGASSGTASGSSSGSQSGSGSGESGMSAEAGPSGAMGGSALDAAAADGAMPTCTTPSTPQDCSALSMTTLPICKLSLTGCMDPNTPTQVTSKAIYYEVNSPLWSDSAAKTRAFVLPAGGKIHVKDCAPNAGDAALSECVAPNGIANGVADTGKWILPVGTVMIKSFMFDGKLVETRLLMRVDDATAQLFELAYGFPPGTEWVGVNYQWNEAQTEAVVLPSYPRTTAMFNTGLRTVAWTFPDATDCVACHTASVGTLGPETAQMNRTVKNANQIDTFVGMGLFDDTAPTKPYANPTVEPYANTALGLTGPPAGATLDQEARSYLSANCGFCHRPDVNYQGFDLRYSLSLHDTGLCGLQMQNGYPNPDGGVAISSYLDFAPGNHANSALWVRMITPAATSASQGDTGRMPTLASYVIDSQGAQLVAQWIDSIKTCPGP
jgi:hypothetical protein